MRFFARFARAGAALAVITGLIFVARNMAWRELQQAVAKIPYTTLGWAIVLNAVNLVAKGGSWWTLMAPNPAVGLGRTVRYSCGAAAISALMPLRAGEALRIWLLRTHHGVRLSELMAVALAEKLLDVASLTCLVLPWLLFAQIPGPLASWRAAALIPAITVFLGTAAWFFIAGVRPPHRRRMPSGGGSFRWLAVMLSFSASQLFAALATLLVGWLADLLLVHVILQAVELGSSLNDCLMVLVALNAAIALPTTPGQLGALELGAAGALSWMGAPAAPAMAFALVYHAVQLVPLWAYLVLDGRFFWRLTRHAT